MSALPRANAAFRPMRASDLDAVAAAEAALYEFPWSRANFGDSLAAGYSAWVMHSGAELIGYALMLLVLDEAHLLNISVVQAWQRRGHGARLLELLIGVAREAGATTMFLEVRPSNDAAIALYRHRGFRQIGRRRGYYPAAGGREDAIVMSTRL